MTSTSRRTLFFVAALSLAIAAVVSIAVWFRREYNHDDFFFAYVSWMRSTGATPGRDFYLPNFTPLAEAFAPLFAIAQESFFPLFVGRVLMLVNAFMLVALSYVVTRRLGSSREWALVAVSVLVWYPDFFRRIADIRGDNIAATFLLATAVFLLADHERATKAGMAIGLALLFAYKVLFAVPVAAAVAVARSQRRMRNAFIFGLAAATPLMTYLGWRILSDGWPVASSVIRELFGSAAGGQSLRWAALQRFVVLSPVAALAIPLGAAGVVRERRGRIYVGCVVAFTAMFVVANPFLFPYNLVIFLPLFTPMIAGIDRLLRRPLQDLAGIAVVVAALSFALPTAVDSFVRTKEPQEALVHWIWRATAPDERIFDWQGLHFGRRGIFHWWNFTGLQRRYASGWYSLADELREGPVTVMIENYRFGGMTARDRAFVSAHYIQSASCILTPGTFQHAAAVARGVAFDVIAPGDYRVVTKPGSTLLIDGQRVGGVVRLAKGPHLIRFQEGTAPGDVALIFTTPRRESAGPAPCPPREILSGFN